jgi:hypothetical protein
MRGHPEAAAAANLWYNSSPMDASLFLALWTLAVVAATSLSLLDDTAHGG